VGAAEAGQDLAEAERGVPGREAAQAGVEAQAPGEVYGMPGKPQVEAAGRAPVVAGPEVEMEVAEPPVGVGELREDPGVEAEWEVAREARADLGV
jgi:hypothetical protein